MSQNLAYGKTLTELTLREASRLERGDRVRFVRDYDMFSDLYVPAGSTGTVVEQGLNEMTPILFVLLDDRHLRRSLAAFDGEAHIGGFDPHDETYWSAGASIERITPPRFWGWLWNLVIGAKQ